MSAHSPGLWEINPIEDGLNTGEIVVWDYDAAGEVEGSTIIVPLIYLDDDQAVADANLLVASPDLLKALAWALPLAKIAIEDHRMGRLKAGHNDITGTYKSGATWVGIYQSEIEEIEFADSAIAKAKGVKP